MNQLFYNIGGGNVHQNTYQILWEKKICARLHNHTESYCVAEKVSCTYPLKNDVICYCPAAVSDCKLLMLHRTIVWFQEIFIPISGKLIGNSKLEGFQTIEKFET